MNKERKKELIKLLKKYCGDHECDTNCPFDSPITGNIKHCPVLYVCNKIKPMRISS